MNSQKIHFKSVDEIYLNDYFRMACQQLYRLTHNFQSGMSICSFCFNFTTPSLNRHWRINYIPRYNSLLSLYFLNLELAEQFQDFPPFAPFPFQIDEAYFSRCSGYRLKGTYVHDFGGKKIILTNWSNSTAVNDKDDVSIRFSKSNDTYGGVPYQSPAFGFIFKRFPIYAHEDVANFDCAAMSFGRHLLRGPFFLTSCAATVLIGGGMYYKEYSACNYKIDRKLDNVTAIVTGTTSGIGQATAKKLAEAGMYDLHNCFLLICSTVLGARVIMACRDMEKCKEERRNIILQTRNKRVVCRHCDLASLKSVAEFAEMINREESKVNLLINNAAVMYAVPLPTVDGFEPHISVNFLGPFLLTLLLLDKLKSSAPSRIINLTDASCKRAKINFDDFNAEQCSRKEAYERSKLASVIWTRELAKRLQNSDVTVNDVFPGYTETEIGRHVKSKFVRLVSWPARKLGLQSVDKAANVVLNVAISSDYADKSGCTFRYDKAAKCCSQMEFGEEVNDPRTQLRLWMTAEKWTKANEVLQQYLNNVQQKPREEVEKKK
ncbi:Retinol dehydrogenase 13 [Trichinella britovi]|uniref:Retinol dehydrogenase 13 n=2 Tax=Trichinella TaxID=6333 RepID=A0A0V1CDK2_TRIBR|nr:Retinol dehydrogenase 13 [Trichinella britovi]